MEMSHDKPITPRSEDYSQWYLDVIAAADLAENSPVRGCMVIKPNGYAIWEKVQQTLDEEFKNKGVQNAYFPLLIPEKFLKREAQHVEGFAPEVAVVTHAGGEKLDEPLVIRPTSETIMYDVFSKWVRSYRDLPLLINQWANVLRWELRTKPFLRTTEFLWQEGHTVHQTQEEADDFARQMLEVYKNFSRDYMAIPVVTGEKTESERFAGALKTYCCEAMMQDGKALQYATSHNLGDNFAKAFDVKYLDKEGVQQYGWQTSWGLSTRSIGGLIMTHSDDKGLVLPPKMATIKVVIVPIFKSDNKEQVMPIVTILKGQIEKSIGIRTVHVDDRENMSIGEKFFEWEKKGVPLRIEIGPKDIEKQQFVAARRDTGAKTFIEYNSQTFGDVVRDTLDMMQQNLLETAQKRLQENTMVADSWDAFVSAIESGKFVMAHWDGTGETEKKIKEEIGATIRCIPFNQNVEPGVCIKTGNPSSQRVLFAKAY
jgi:prolyl-tRNA synthetase